jgi:hypothetical protein
VECVWNSAGSIVGALTGDRYRYVDA